eukprot:1773569-Rhodomonas_salina.1
MAPVSRDTGRSSGSVAACNGKDRACPFSTEQLSCAAITSCTQRSAHSHRSCSGQPRLNCAPPVCGLPAAAGEMVAAPWMLP